MNALPFTLTQEAEAKIERIWLDAQKDLRLLAKARVLAYAENHSWTTKEGGEGCYPFGHVLVGWHPLEDVIHNSEFTELELAGFRVFIHKGTMERIRGRCIVVDKGKGIAGVGILAVKDMNASSGEE